MVKFGNRMVGDGQPCFITMEAGPTHDGVDSAKRLISHAAAAGADAIKFQILDPDRLVADRTIMFDYDVLVDRETGRTETVSERLYDLLARRALDADQWREVKKHSDEVGLAFFATVGFEDEIELVASLGCDSIKIASADVNHFPLIRRAARTGMCLQLDTGNSSLGEIEAAVDVIRSEGNENIIIHHCPGGYPARAESINLRVIETLKQMFAYPIAYSDHTPGWEMDIAAIAMGANLVEKTITEDRMTRGVEHVMSIEPEDMKRFVQSVRDLEKAFGSRRRIMQDAELKKRERIRRSVFVKSDARAGVKLSDLSVEFRRPGNGIAPDRYEALLEKRLRTDLVSGYMLTEADLL